jgi:hypothetical protein
MSQIEQLLVDVLLKIRKMKSKRSLGAQDVQVCVDYHEYLFEHANLRVLTCLTM